MKVYISGPMTGYPDYNYKAFRVAAEGLTLLGHEPLNPADNFDGDTSLPRSTYMRKDVEMVLAADAVLVLEGWQQSKGATLEVAIAREIGLPILEFAPGTYPLRELPYETPLQEAQRIVHGNRQASYGHPLDDFTRTGRMWGAILGLPDAVAPEKVGLCMAAVKISRECNRPGRDNRVDLAGYAETVDLVVTERERRK